MRNATNRRVVRVSRLDWKAAGSPIAVVVGPVTALDEKRALENLTSLSGRGCDGRVGLHPRIDSRRWSCGTPGFGAAHTDVTFDGDVGGAVTECATWSIDAEPVQVAVTNHFVMVVLDHGIGDLHVLFKMTAALSTAEQLVSSAATSESDVAFPMIRIVVRSCRQQPWRVVRGLLAVGRDVMRRYSDGYRKAPPATQLTRTSESVTDPVRHHSAVSTPQVVTPLAVFEVSDGDLVERLADLREHHGGSVSISALIAHAISSSLKHEIPEMVDEFGLLVDMRKYLDRQPGTLENFVAVARVRYQPDVLAFAEEFHGAANDPLLPIRLAGSLLLTSRKPKQHLSQRRLNPSGVVGPPVMTMSNLTRLPAATAFDWYPDTATDRVFAVGLPPIERNHIAIAVTAVEPRLQVTAMFWPDAVDADAVRRALRTALNVDSPRRDANG